MDEAERQRSQPTVNARWGNSLSVLLGDCLFAQALNLSTNFDNAEISRAIARAVRDVCSGEIIQTQRRFDLHLAIDDYLRIIKMKTGSPFGVAAELGATINGAGSDAIHAMKAFGLKFGAAYKSMIGLPRYRGEREGDWQNAGNRFAQRQDDTSCVNAPAKHPGR